MENLPPNLILKILEYIPIRNRLKLRTISKQFKEIIEFKIPDKLILLSEYYLYNYSYGNYMKYDKFLNDNNLLIIKDEQFFYSTYLFKLRRIKKLKSILNKNEYLISVDHFFNLFEELVELKILNYHYNIDINLKLKKLRKLKFNFYSTKNLRLKLDTPSLIDLKIIRLDSVDIIYPDKLLKLRILFFSNDESDLGKLYKFKNLEQLKIINTHRSFEILNRELYERLTNLKKLIILDRFLKSNSNNESTQRIQENKLNLIKNFDYRRENLEIVINRLEIDQFKYIRTDNFPGFLIKSIVENFSKIKNIKSKYINYGQLIKLFNYELPINFHSKITNIKFIRINKRIDDESKLVNFIKKSNANWLCISIKLSKSFYQQLNNENVCVNNLEFERENNLNIYDKQFIDLGMLKKALDFILNPKIRFLRIFTDSLSSDFEFITRSLINYNLRNIFISFDKISRYIRIHLYDNNFTFIVSCSNLIRARYIGAKLENKMNLIEFFNMLNLIRQLSIDCDSDILKLIFLIDRINLINFSYLIMIKKLFKTYDISKDILEFHSI